MMAKKQLDFDVNQSFLKTVANKVILKKNRVPTTFNDTVHLPDFTVYYLTV